MKILGISGSPVPGSNTDRLVLQVLKATGLDFEFVKLSTVNVRPCLACKACVEDNICKVNDDFPALAKKLLDAQALVIGGYTPYRVLDGFTKAFLERLWSMRHLHSLNENKYVITIISGLFKEIRDGALDAIATELFMERMHHVAELSIEGNVPCLTCGYGDNCKNSGIPHVFPNKIKASKDHCIAVEKQPVWEEATNAGNLLGQFLRGEIDSLPYISHPFSVS
ncbi:MAG TPA: flavodoxin family protein [Methylomusa anaerophila]|uniref:NADPH-dependent FMN reductase n=1 Tax=Methylomusa anaerophila TaxID=1930071 RepID=A0A348AND4_9FIRM|nr:flavodoxin family protein [Methylomusa anaerophila]BBB92582.1 NADPH-dependent FMN reductase [Methylomusa anaerophila]HML87563.1 flavodoxin family protein [Methylomusa anaerophila]